MITNTTLIDGIYQKIDKIASTQKKTSLRKREYFASLFMQALINRYEGRDPNQFLFDINNTIPRVAVMYADLLIKELKGIPNAEQS
jgi:hypothetical protein